MAARAQSSGQDHAANRSFCGDRSSGRRNRCRALLRPAGGKAPHAASVAAGRPGAAPEASPLRPTRWSRRRPRRPFPRRCPRRWTLSRLPGRYRRVARDLARIRRRADADLARGWSDYQMTTVSTANGKIKAAPVRLARVEIGDITVFDVPALGAARRGVGAEPARRLVVLSRTPALRIRRRPHGARAIIRPAIIATMVLRIRFAGRSGVGVSKRWPRRLDLRT